MTESSVAVFIDVENIHNSCRNHYSAAANWSWISDACHKYGRVTTMQAFGDWTKYQHMVPEVQRCGIKPVLTPLSKDGKSSADSYIIVEAMKLFCLNDYLDTMILASGDRDFMPLIMELRSMGKKVIVLSVPQAMSKDLLNYTDAVIEYRPDKSSEAATVKKPTHSIEDDLKAAKQCVIETLASMSADGDWVHLAALGLELRKKHPEFSHQAHGYKKLANMLVDIPEIETQTNPMDKSVSARVTGTIDVELHRGTIDKLGPAISFIRSDKDRKRICFFNNRATKIDLEKIKRGDHVSYRVETIESVIQAVDIELLT